SLSDETRLRITHATEEIANFFKRMNLSDKLSRNMAIWKGNAANKAKTADYLIGKSERPGSPCASFVTIDQEDWDLIRRDKNLFDSLKNDITPDRLVWMARLNQQEAE
ncbi:hypothetical protein BT96DRAFT_784008, partial [Gymnopus androsaceus JB14]